MSLTIFQQLLQPIRDPKSEAAHHCRRTLNQICDQSPELDGTGDFYMPQFAQVTECEMSWIKKKCGQTLSTNLCTLIQVSDPLIDVAKPRR